jgi:outer membrane protein OmpA-like peptidoglycan-associated protein
MKQLKLSAVALSLVMLFSGCSMSNTAKGGLIGGGGGGALGALIGQLAGGGKGAAIGAAVGTAVGAGAGVLIGNKMDKAKKAAEMANAEAEIMTDSEGTQYVKATFSSGLLFATGSSKLSASAVRDINTFVTNLKAEDSTFDIVIDGYTDNQGWRNCTAAQSKEKNQQLSLERALAVQNQIVTSGYSSSRIISVKGYGEDNPVASNATAAGQEQNRRVEVFILPSKDMINAANAASQK